MISITTIDGNTRTVKDKANIIRIWFEGNTYTPQLVKAKKLQPGNYILTEQGNRMRIKTIQK